MVVDKDEYLLVKHRGENPTAIAYSGPLEVVNGQGTLHLIRPETWETIAIFSIRNLVLMERRKQP